MRPLPFPAAVLLAGAAALALSSAASAQPGWNTLEFDMPPGFSIRFPPGFAPEVPGGQDPQGGMLVTFRLLDRSNGRVVTLAVGKGTFTRAERMTLDREGGRFWDETGKGIAEQAGTFDGAEPFRYQGFKAADMYFSGTEETEDGGKVASLGAQRLVVVGDDHVSLSCFAYLDAGEAGVKGYTSRENPVVAEYCRPYFDSLEFLN